MRRRRRFIHTRTCSGGKTNLLSRGPVAGGGGGGRGEGGEGGDLFTLTGAKEETRGIVRLRYTRRLLPSISLISFAIDIGVNFRLLSLNSFIFSKTAFEASGL